MTTRYIDDTYTFYAVSTRFDTGAATDADAVLPYRVYEEETTTPLLTGNMALLDSANTAGLYSEQITLSAANGFEVGKCYCVHIAGTVNSVTGATVREFVVRKKPLTPTTEGRELDVSAGGEAGVDWANVGSPTTTVNLSGTTVKTATDVETDTQDIQTKIGTPSDLGGGATVAANLADIEAQTDDIGAAGAGLTALATQASVNTIDDFLDTEIAAIKTETDKIASIKTKTDSLTFTVANQLDANVQSVNDAELTGDGSVVDPWGPA